MQRAIQNTTAILLAGLIFLLSPFMGQQRSLCVDFRGHFAVETEALHDRCHAEAAHGGLSEPDGPRDCSDVTLPDDPTVSFKPHRLLALELVAAAAPTLIISPQPVAAQCLSVALTMPPPLPCLVTSTVLLI